MLTDLRRKAMFDGDALGSMITFTIHFEIKMFNDNKNATVFVLISYFNVKEN